jgi:hypothetical protein
MVGFSSWVTVLLGLASFVFGIILSIRTGGDGDNYYQALGHVIINYIYNERVVKAGLWFVFIS